MTGCHVCNKHKFTCIFYEQETHDLANCDMVEVSNPKVIEQVYENLNVSILDEKEQAPIICGTVLNGGFHRKLRMLRADMFSMLSVCQSMNYMDSHKMSRKIRKGILEMVKRSQDVNKLDETIPFFKGWEDNLILDKVINN